MANHVSSTSVGAAAADITTRSRGSAAWSKRFLALSISVVSVIIAAAGYTYYRSETQLIRTQKYREISAIAASKSDQIVRWLKERAIDARRLAESPTLRTAIEALLKDSRNRPFLGEIQEGLKLECDTAEYADAELFTPSGRRLLSAHDASEPLDDSLRQTIHRALLNHGPVSGELRRTASGKVYVETVATVRDASGAALAVVVLSNNAEDFLFPMMQAWPTPSRTAETLIVRRDGVDVLFLNELRHRKGTALVFRQSLTLTRLPASAAARGQTGEFYGSDYRGLDVLADLRTIPGTAWFMVAKEDTAEILAEVRYRAFAVLAGVVMAILLVAAIASYMYRTRQSAERRRAAVAVLGSEALLKESQLVAALGHYVFDAATGAWTGSEGLDAVFGIGPDFQRDIAGWTSLVHPDDREEMVAYLAGHVMKGGYPFDKDYRISRVSDGAVRWVHGMGQVDRDADGNPLRMFGTIQDITERRMLEQVLRERNEELIRFVYTVSHDLKSPLVTIRTFLGFLVEDRKQPDESRIENDIGFIRLAAEKMSALLDDLLELSRIGRKMNPPVDVPLQTLVRDALEMVAGRVAQSHARVTVTQAPVILHGDRPRLLEVFENLIDNAAKFTGDQSDPLVEIGVEEAGEEIVIFVRDNGVGIDPRHQSKLFGLFEKLHPATDGTGIGLALIKRIIEVHGGRIWAESAGPGRGSTFKFTLSGTTRQ